VALTFDADTGLGILLHEKGTGSLTKDKNV